MALDATIGGEGTLFVGEDKTLRFELVDASGLPIDFAAWATLFDVRLKDNTPDPAIFSKTVVAAGVFNAVRALNAQRGYVIFTDTELNTVSAKTYRHSWKRMDDGSETVLAWGNIIFQKATAP